MQRLAGRARFLTVSNHPDDLNPTEQNLFFAIRWDYKGVLEYPVGAAQAGRIVQNAFLKGRAWKVYFRYGGP